MTTTDLTLGPRPDEPHPPITGPTTYPPDTTTQLTNDATTIINRYPHPRSALLPLLHLVQSHDTYLTPAGITFCANQLHLTTAEVTAVATFYTMYRRQPTGRYLVGVCTNTLCAIMGGDNILTTLQHHLNITPGNTTPDGHITLEHLECNAACDYAPIIMINWEFFDNQTPTTAHQLITQLQNNHPPTPTRGHQPIPPFTTTARTLAGLPDPNHTPDPKGTAGATLAGVRVARALDMTAPPSGSGDGAAVPVSHSGSEQDQAAESVRDQPAPAPSATVPPEPDTPETDPAATESGD